ncbi:aldo/keto reductase [Mesorhizobium sp. XAP10]|uniref:aldo/keto reductase n=1 Tax=unclassified Mesorhizobium TaxID=325217 RepID=UPI0023DE9031|nr:MULTISPECIES: aldo/keto reductase [unclassified Mesorhizobium]MDF3154533.1 aldo/keto reductase [Mesorhizobium sp. XAP10]MDF3247917.1 aldo/keto reductase [Mesorhizobium sp. XAP4]
MDTKTFTTNKGRKLDFSSLGFGSAPLGDLFEKLDEITAIDTVRAAYDVGMRVFDSSPFYGHGLSESRCGTALRTMPRDEVIFSTKVGRTMNPFVRNAQKDPRVFSIGFPHQASFDYSYDGAMRSVEQSLLRTGLSEIDILLIHDCDVWTHGKHDANARFAEAMDGAYKALDKLRADGTVKAIGCGLNEVDTCERFVKAGDFDVMLLAGRYSLLEQPAIQSFLPLAVQKNIGIILAGVFNSGILATGPVKGAKYNYAEASPEVMAKVVEIQKVCDTHGVPLHRAALHFATFHPAVVTVILGGVKRSEVEANGSAIAQPVPVALWADLKSAGLLDPAAHTPN